MGEGEWLATSFETHRPHLRAVAYRMLGSLSEADDVVQDAWFRFSRSDVRQVKNPRAWLTTVVARLCLDALRSRRARREDPIGVRVPEPIVSSPDGIDPEQRALLADSVELRVTPLASEGPALAPVVPIRSPDPAEGLLVDSGQPWHWHPLERRDC